MSHICVIIADVHAKSEANWKLSKHNRAVWITVSDAGSGVCEVTNQRRLATQGEQQVVMVMLLN